LENLSTVSPSGVNEFDVDSFYHNTTKTDFVTDGFEFEYDDVDAGGYGATHHHDNGVVVVVDNNDEGVDAYYGQDPLEWLLDNDTDVQQHLPESSLSAPPPPTSSTTTTTTAPPPPLFPDCADSDHATGTALHLLPIPPPQQMVAPSSSTHTTTTDVTDNLPYADPKVTVQSLFLPPPDHDTVVEDHHHHPLLSLGLDDHDVAALAAVAAVGSP